MNTNVREEVDLIPSAHVRCGVKAGTESPEQSTAGAVGVLVAAGNDAVSGLTLDPATTARFGFHGEVGQTFIAGSSGQGATLVAVGTGPAERIDAAVLRNAAAAFVTAVAAESNLAIAVPTVAGLDAGAAAQALVEGALLARYSFSVSSRPAKHVALETLTLLTSPGAGSEVEAGLERGRTMAAAAALSRDLATCPPSMLTAARMADVAQEVGSRSGLTVDVFDLEQLRSMGCGGLLGVNRGSVDEPRMIKLSYPGVGSAGRLTLVGKGIMYDSGGISLKPSDAVHATMKNDMSGAGAILGAMSVLADLECRAAVTAYLMCTDNMPSGSALKLGDVITMRGGTTVEVLNTDAEGRLVMADALVLATEEPVDAIVDIATLTGATMRALGVEIAGVMGNNDALLEQVRAAAAQTDEQVWPFPLARQYRTELDSTIADLTNMGGPNAGGITAALFLEEFVGDVPWAHIDIAGTAQADQAKAWRTKGPTGFGARLLVDLALRFEAPVRHTDVR